MNTINCKHCGSYKCVTGKQHTIGIEQNNSNIRHFLGRFTRRTKVVSKSATMVLATLKICWYINENNGFDEYVKILYLFLVNTLKIKTTLNTLRVYCLEFLS